MAVQAAGAARGVKPVVRLLGLLGLGGVALLIAYERPGSVLAPLALAGWRLLWLVPLHALPLTLDVLGWLVLLQLLDRERHTGPLELLGIATVREAVDRLLPVASIGGGLAGIRLLVRRGVDGPAAAASVVVEVLLTLIAQYLFAALGVLALLRLVGVLPSMPAMLLSLAAALPVIAGLALLLRYGSLFERAGRLIESMLGERSQWRALLQRLTDLDARIRELYGARERLFTCVFWQLAGMIAGTLETWLALRWLGHPVGLLRALALESLMQTVRQFMFFVPGGLGVQEAGLVGFGLLLGIAGPTALALSLAKRLRELLIGLPALGGWHWVESRGVPALPAGSSEHRQLLARFFTDTHVPYVPDAIQWPRLQGAALARLTSLPFWQEAVSTEHVTSQTVAAAAALEPDPQVRAAIALQGIEEQRHARLLQALTAHYRIPVQTPVHYEPRHIEEDFLFAGFGECFDSFFAFGLFAVARESRYFAPGLLEIFEQVIQEEARHILFFVNWVKYRRRLLSWWRRPLFRLRCARIILRQALSRLRTARELGAAAAGRGSAQQPGAADAVGAAGTHGEHFTLGAHRQLGDSITLHRLLEIALRENERRLSAYDARLARPRLVPGLARVLCRVLPQSL